MRLLWKLKKAFINDIVASLPDPKPHYNTISSIVRLLEKKKMVGYESFGKTHRYFPLISMNQYKKTLMQTLISNYFDNSYSNLLSFIIEEEEISDKERIALKKLANTKGKK